MRPRTEPRHAGVRVGSLGRGTLTAGWPATRDCHGSPCYGGRTVTGTLLAADARSPARRLETADVIVTAGRAGSTGPDGWLRRYPGCAVAASWAGPGVCLVATRNGVLRRMAVSDPSVVGTLACGVFMHGWLAAGWSPDLLQPADLNVSHDAGVGLVPGTPLFFRFSYCAAPGDELEASDPAARPDSASRTCRASGAPSAS